MTPERWRQIEELYHEASARPSDERETFLDVACGSDTLLRNEVRSLLNRQPSQTDWLEGGPAAPLLESPLRPGQRLGVYEVRGLLGAGGMGQVHRAYDTRLAREVAVKVLPQPFVADSQRLARFEREARVLASLNHPNVGAIYGIEDTTAESGQRIHALILELVEGPTLAERVGRGPLRIEEAIHIAVQIADALAAAHDKGIVHRDLKPANVKITPLGTVKVLDFGLATAAASLHSPGDSRTQSLVEARTQPGTLLGTVPYMSPEQARGLPVDRRTDVWAFGCVLLEMLTGKPAFPGDTMSDIIAGILEREPPWSALPAATPEAVHRVLRWALTKDPQRRLRDLGDARLELEASNDGRTTGSASPPRRPWVLATAGMAVSLIVGALISRVLPPKAVETPRITSNFAIPVGPTEVLVRNVAISPDARYIAYLAGPSGHQQTYLRAVGERQSRVISELPLQATQPFFSPDSQWIAYFDAGKLKKMPIGGGSAETLAEAPTPRGGTWGPNDTIVFAPISRGGLMSVSATGGPVQALTTPDRTRGETSHRFPAFVLESTTILFVADSSSTSGRSVQAVSIDTKRVSIVTTGDAILPRAVPIGYLAYLDNGKLQAAPFDVSALRLTGTPVTLAEQVDAFSFSADGTLVYTEAPADNIRASTLVWTGRDGVVSPLPLPPALYDHPRLSPDGHTVVVHKETPGDRNLWVYDTGRETLTKLTFAGSNDWPVWSADGKRILYASNRPQTQYDILAKPVDGSGPEATLLVRPLTQIPRAVSPTGDAVIFEETSTDQPNTLWRLPLDAKGEPRPLFASSAGEMMPTFSPDGRWIAYVSPQAGHNEVYVRASTGEGRTWQISSDGGVEPVWSFSGRELFYRTVGKMMVVDVTQSTPPAFGKPRVLFEGNYLFGNTEGQDFDVSRDGRRFLLLKPQQEPPATPVNVIVNWFDDLRRRLPVSR